MFDPVISSMRWLLIKAPFSGKQEESDDENQPDKHFVPDDGETPSHAHPSHTRTL